RPRSLPCMWSTGCLGLAALSAIDAYPCLIRQPGDFVDDLFDGATIGIDDYRVTGGGERRGLAGRVEVVTRLQVGEHGLVFGFDATLLEFDEAAASSFLGAGVEEH